MADNIFAMIHRGYRPLPPAEQVQEQPDYDQVEPGFACSICGESDHDNLVNRDGIVHCATCGHDYDLEPEREAGNA